MELLTKWPTELRTPTDFVRQEEVMAARPVGVRRVNMCRRTHARRKLRHAAIKLSKLTQEEKLKVPHA